MALDNLISVQFSSQELEKINQAIILLNEVLAGKIVNLTPDERRQYGSIADRNKVLVDKAKFYMEAAPETLPRTIDKIEFDNDYIARGQIESPLKALQLVTEKLSDTKILLDFDNFQATLAYYRYVKYLAEQNEPGTTTIYQDLKQHYSSGVTTASDTSDTTQKG